MASITAANGQYGEAVGLSHLEPREHTERRRNRRVPLAWAVYIKWEDLPEPLLTKTRNISSAGFYCLLTQSVRPGERLECEIVVPTHGSRSQSDVVHLRCQARALRVEEIHAGKEFGLACRIEEYHVVNGTPLLVQY